MKPAHLRANALGILLFITSSSLLIGCYTQFSGNQGDYYGYTGHVHKAPRPVHSDTIVERPAQAPPASQMTAKYDTVVKGDTIFIDEHPKAQLAPAAEDGSTTIINNYYDDSWNYPSYWDYYWHPHHHAVISI